jgi:cold-inducible RNA-binding protein
MKLFVTNIPWDSTEEDLRTFIVGRGYGVSNVKIVVSPETGRSRGFAFVTLEDSSFGDRALRELEGELLGGRPLHVAVAHDKRSGGGRRGGSSGGGSRDGGRRGGDGRSRGRGDRGTSPPDDYGWGE